jgi:hypothetical protein
MEALATYFDMESAHSVAGIYADFVLLWQQILNSLEWTISVNLAFALEIFHNFINYKLFSSDKLF